MEDYKGLRIRIWSPETVASSIRLLGAQPVRMPVAEVYMALERGIADSTLATISSYSYFKYNEILPFLSLTNHFYISQVLIINKMRFDRIGPEFQKILSEAAIIASKYQREIFKKTEEEILKKMEEKGVKVIRNPDREAMREAVQPIYEETKKSLDCRDCKKFPWCCLW